MTPFFNDLFIKLRGKKILISGASGLIASAFIDMVFAQMDPDAPTVVYALSRDELYARERFKQIWFHPAFKYLKHNIVSPISIDGPIDYIIHAASNASPAKYALDPVGTIQTNIYGTENLLRLARDKSARLLYISSGEVYGSNNKNAMSEDDYGYIDLSSSRSCYPEGKRVSEVLCMSYMSQYNVDVVIARPCHVYGADICRDNRAVAEFLRCAKEHRDIVLKSDGKQVRSYCYVEDCATAILYVLLRGKRGEAYNISNKNSIVSIRDLAQKIASVASVSVVCGDASSIEQKGYSQIQRAVLNSSKLEALGWSPHYALDNAIDRIISLWNNVS